MLAKKVFLSQDETEDLITAELLQRNSQCALQHDEHVSASTWFERLPQQRAHGTKLREQDSLSEIKAGARFALGDQSVCLRRKLKLCALALRQKAV